MTIGKESIKQVVVFFGLIASGKSFLAKAWAKKHRCPYYNTDVVRKQLAGIAATEPRPEAVGQGIYSPEFTRLTYDAMLTSAGQALADPAVSCVALDGSYQSRAERDRVRNSLVAHRARVAFVLCSCAEEIVKVRLAERAADPAAVSDGRWEIYLRQKETFENPDELPPGQCQRIDTNEAVGVLLRHLDHFLSANAGSG
jgi:predicted kinase